MSTEATGWRKASYSNPYGSCVEVGQAPGTIAVRDTADRSGPELRVSPSAWAAFTASLRP